MISVYPIRGSVCFRGSPCFRDGNYTTTPQHTGTKTVGTAHTRDAHDNLQSLPRPPAGTPYYAGPASDAASRRHTHGRGVTPGACTPRTPSAAPRQARGQAAILPSGWAPPLGFVRVGLWRQRATRVGGDGGLVIVAQRDALSERSELHLPTGPRRRAVWGAGRVSQGVR